MSEMKRPKRYALEGIDRGKFFYYADQADAYFAALERRARIAERKSEILSECLAKEITAGDAEHYNRLATFRSTREIDAEIAQEGR